VQRGKTIREQNQNNDEQTLRNMALQVVAGMQFKNLANLSWSQEVQRALHKIHKNWGTMIDAQRLSQPFQGAELDRTIKIIPDDQWVTKYKQSGMGLKSDPNDSAGVTYPASVFQLTWPRTIMVRGGVYTFGTVVHELLHFLCHDRFWTAFGHAITVVNEMLLDEGITEYFTQKAVPKADRSLHYPLEVLDVQYYLGAKLFTEEDLVKAYFAGDQAAIDKIQGAPAALKSANLKGGRKF
jgi:hypothetical protein